MVTLLSLEALHGAVGFASDVAVVLAAEAAAAAALLDPVVPSCAAKQEGKRSNISNWSHKGQTV